MKRFVLFVVFGLVSLSWVNAQISMQETDLMRSILKSEIKVFFAQNIKLKTAETALFWEVYEQYEKELKPIGNSRIIILKKVMNSSGKLSGDEVDDVIKEAIKLDKKRRGLRERYYKIYKKKMGLNIAAQFYQLDSYINTLVASALMQEQPFIRPE